MIIETKGRGYRPKGDGWVRLRKDSSDGEEATKGESDILDQLSFQLGRVRLLEIDVETLRGVKKDPLKKEEQELIDAHNSLDKLAADFIATTQRLLAHTSVLELMTWLSDRMVMNEGKVAIAEGQLVAHKESGTWTGIEVWPNVASPSKPELYEQIKVSIDDSGRAIVQEK
ncbi:hypothetical protein LCGC14_3030250 [marine sediment metagenome]|uniref:Uncharacterized protein n=1 Tax=marine sediment metagenome TaxID=412755 RepID=A0A0F8WSJ4_9ZZZZ